MIEHLPIADLVLDPRNPRLHGDRALGATVASLKRFGQQRPILVTSDNMVLAGNGVLQAAKALGWTDIAIVRTKLTGAEATAYGITDNRTAELSTWDRGVLGSVLRDLDDADMQALGWTESEWRRVTQTPAPTLDTDEEPTPLSDAPDPFGDDDEPPEISDPVFTNHVRLVQLFVPLPLLPQFEAELAMLQHNGRSVTDVVVEAIQRAADRCRADL